MNKVQSLPLRGFQGEKQMSEQEVVNWGKRWNSDLKWSRAVNKPMNPAYDRRKAKEMLDAFSILVPFHVPTRSKYQF